MHPTASLAITLSLLNLINALPRPYLPLAHDLRSIGAINDDTDGLATLVKKEAANTDPAALANSLSGTLSGILGQLEQAAAAAAAATPSAANSSQGSTTPATEGTQPQTVNGDGTSVSTSGGGFASASNGAGTITSGNPNLAGRNNLDTQTAAADIDANSPYLVNRGNSLIKSISE